MLHLYNTLTRTKEPFKPLRQEITKVYYCGPTPYNYAHIGNLRTYLFSDFVVRTLRFLGNKVETTMNITDIDDKTIRDSIKEGVALQEFTEKYTKFFLEDLETLSIVPADHIAPISGLIDEMVEIINVLLKRGFAYVADDGSIYYSISKFKTYGELAGLDRKGMKTSVRINNDEYDKESAADFALWKAYDPASDGENKWEGKFIIDGEERVLLGRPGWHIECSACNLKYFGPQIDIHMGGVDNIFPHHQNEIAQTEAYSGKPFAKYWMHGGHLLVENKKMAKSAGNFYTLRDIIAKYPEVPKAKVARAFRLMALSNRYRENFNFLFSRLEASIKTIEGLDALILRLKREKTEEGRVRRDFREFVQNAMMDFCEFLEDDINTPEALASVHTFISHLNAVMDEEVLRNGEMSAAIELLKSFDSVLGVFDFSLLDDTDFPSEALDLLDARNAAKTAKDFATADSCRSKIEALGYRVVDTKEGSVLEKIS